MEVWCRDSYVYFLSCGNRKKHMCFLLFLYLWVVASICGSFPLFLLQQKEFILLQCINFYGFKHFSAPTRKKRGGCWQQEIDRYLYFLDLSSVYCLVLNQTDTKANRQQQILLSFEQKYNCSHLKAGGTEKLFPGNLTAWVGKHRSLLLERHTATSLI